MSFRRTLGAILVLALIVRVGVIVATPHFKPINDSADYDRYAVSLVQSGRFPDSQLTPGPTAFRAPLFPLALAAAYEVVGAGSTTTRWAAGRVLEALFGTVTVALIALIALRIWNRRVALIAAAITAVYPPLILIGSSLMSESLFIPLNLAAVLAALVTRDARGTRRLSWSVGTGVLTGLAALARSTDLILVLPIAFIVWSERPRLSMRSLRAPAIAVAATLLTLVPWLVRDANVMHTFVPITDESGYAAVGTYNSYAQTRTDDPALYTPPVLEARKLERLARGLNEAQFSSKLDTLSLDYIDAHPSSVLKTAYWTTLRLLDLTGTAFEQSIEPTWGFPGWLAVVSVYAFWLVALLAVAGACSRAARRAPWSFWICPIALLATTVLLIGATRYRTPADPWIVLLAALAVASGAQRRRSARGGGTIAVGS
ncbi:MAG TPA: glycosyltransferase family 39 protein [Solirubrobacteraceae bacterium]|nr:glycosyltransferase family 39 protein [Solirubrobacteraceae bacterium]